jgi:hypothetical protein
MAAPKGRPHRARNGERTLYATVAAEVIDRLNAGAVTMNLTRAAYIELLVGTMPVDERGLPPWLAIMADMGEEPEPAAA